MTEAVLDASAILAFLRREPGAEVVRPFLRGGRLSAVNYAEILARAADIGIALESTEHIMNDLGVVRISFDDAHAKVTASLRPLTKKFGLSLADRACLALASLSDLPVLTSDARWKEAGLGVEVRLIR
ncbi:MAG: PIN domain-containing protein [Phycisphaerales bacterium]